MAKHRITLFIVCLVLLTMLGVGKAAEQVDVKPYEFAVINDPGFNVGTTHIYKAVHQGCELFVAIDSSGNSDHGRGIALTTGRGCK